MEQQSDDLITIETEHFLVEMGQEEYDSVQMMCKRYNITENYYFHEFDDTSVFVPLED
jgi:hypothetical protein|tara:strand:- start:520 stop:693 length:174 start_codon:yes stop_codon:yes gene_type:complete